MFERWHGPEMRTDREYLLRMGVFPALATILAMAVGFSLVAGILFVRESLIVDNVVTQVLGVTVMFVLPLFVVGLWIGYRYGRVATPALVAGATPLVVLILALGAFGGPMSTPFESPLLAVGAVAVWSVVCALGTLAGASVLAPRLDDRRQTT